MKIKIEIDGRLTEPEIILRSSKLTPQLSNIADIIENFTGTRKVLFGYKGAEAFPLSPENISSIYTENDKVLARCGNEVYTVKSRLYELEEMFAGTELFRISNCEIVNFKKVKSLDMSRTGTIILKFKTGEITYASRRYVNKIKKYFDL